MKVDFGVIDHLDRQNRPIHETYDSRLELIQAYDRAGFTTFHITEHHFTPLGLAPSPLVFLAAASRITERIRFAPLVLIITLYNPLRLAGEICMLDHLTKGRLDIGAGRGISPYELAYFNVNHLEAPSIYREGLEVVMAALTRDVVDYRGNYFKYFNVPIELHPYQKPHPPLWYATGNPESAAWAGRQNMNIVFLLSAAQARVLADRFKDGWTAAHGASGKPMPKVGITRHIYVADTDAEAEERGMVGFKGWFDKFGYLWQKYDPRPFTFDDAVHRKSGRLIFGSPSTVRAEIERQIAESGVNYFVARFAYGDLGHAESLRSLRLFTDEVMPHFQGKAAERV